MSCRFACASAVFLAVTSGAAAWGAEPGATIAANGPPVPGVCLFSKEQTLQTSKAGASASEQIRQFAAAAAAKLKPDRDAIAQENQTLMEQRTTLAPAQMQQRALALQQKSAEFQEASQQRTAQLQQTQVNAGNRILNSVNPALTAASAAHHCSIIMERGQVYGFNGAMDLTAEVIKRLDATLTPFKVELAAAPATPTPRK